MDYLRLGPALREARKARSLTQIQLKEQLGCSQSQISELEQGIHNAVSRDLLNRIAETLGVDLSEFERQEISTAPEASKYGYCANQACPAARPFVVSGIPRMKPHFVTLASGAKNCEFCGDVLACQCQQGDCGFPVNPGFFCRRCGKPFIDLPNSVTNKETAEAKARQVDEFLRQFEA